MKLMSALRSQAIQPTTAVCLKEPCGKCSRASNGRPEPANSICGKDYCNGGEYRNLYYMQKFIKGVPFTMPLNKKQDDSKQDDNDYVMSLRFGIAAILNSMPDTEIITRIINEVQRLNAQRDAH